MAKRAQVPGRIVQRGGSWAAVIYVGSERIATPDGGTKLRKKYRWIAAPTRDAAQARLVEALHEKGQGTLPEARAKLTLGTWLRDWLDGARPGLAARTAHRYAGLVDDLVGALGDRSLVRLSPADIRRAYARLRRGDRPWRAKVTDETGEAPASAKRPLSETTLRQVHAVLHKALAVAVKDRLLGRNPADDVEPPKPRKHEIQPPDEAATRALLDAIQGTRWGLPTLMAATTGLRRGEILGLQWTDFDLQAGTLAIRRSLEETPAGVAYRPTKTERPRVVSLPAMTVAALKAHRAEAKLRAGQAWRASAPIFPGPDGGPWSPESFTSGWRAWGRAHGFTGLRFHDLRHAHATHLLRAGIPLKVVSARLGHSNIAITGDLYQHVLSGMDEAAAAAVDHALDKSRTAGQA